MSLTRRPAPVTAPATARRREVNGHSHRMFCCCLSLQPFPWSRRTAVLHLAVSRYIYGSNHSGTSRDNKRFLSHGICRCTRSSLRCRGTRRFVICLLGSCAAASWRCISRCRAGVPAVPRWRAPAPRAAGGRLAARDGRRRDGAAAAGVPCRGYCVCGVKTWTVTKISPSATTGC